MRLSALALTLCAGAAAAEPPASLETLGEQLFLDVNLSKNRTMACATCHAPEFGFVDPRQSDLGQMVSLGDDGVSLGDRNAPTASYAAFAPEFHQNKDGHWVGGQFLDGREPNLAGQAGGPPLNPIEMGMPDKASVVARLKENPDYVAAFSALFGTAVWDDDAEAYLAMTQAIAAYEGTAEFAPFDSKYDRYLRGEVKLTDMEELGRTLFFSEQFTNCSLCHLNGVSALSPQETFSNYEFHNIGVPVNRIARAGNGSAADVIDHGLLSNAAVDDPLTDGQFKVPTLRNIAVTGPYMHNGVFDDLRTVILFYNKYNSVDPARQINPETGAPWAEPEVPGTLSMTELEHGPALDDMRVDALVAFLKTLTDARYEDLLEE